jgi:hypothetical protein
MKSSAINTLNFTYHNVIAFGCCWKRCPFLPFHLTTAHMFFPLAGRPVWQQGVAQNAAVPNVSQGVAVSARDFTRTMTGCVPELRRALSLG